MKKILLSLASLSMILLLSFSNPGAWVKFTSTAGHYSIDFPGKPTETTEANGTDPHAPRIHFATFSPSDTEGYMIDWVDMGKTYPKGVTIKQILEDSRDGAVRSFKPANMTTIATDLGDNPSITFTFSNSTFAGKGRIYIINKFQYALLTLFSPNAGISPDADKFINSFKHLQ